MILKKCHIENFGTLHEVDFDFVEGLNTIREDNGWGKTTLAAFIKAMLYGLEYRQNTKAFYDRKKYEPWQGGVFGGSLTFETEDGEYKVLRTFGKKDTGDTFELRDLGSGLISDKFTDKLGEEIFGIDLDSFERSIFVKLTGEVKSTDAINAKLNNLVDNTDDVNNYENADAILDKELKDLKKRGGTGRIDQVEKSIRDNEEEINRCNNTYIRISELERKIGEYEGEKKKLCANKEEVENQIKVATMSEKKKQLVTIEEKLEKNKDNLSKTRSFFVNDVPSMAEINRYLAMASKHTTLTNEIVAGQVEDSESARYEELVRIGVDKINETEVDKYINNCREVDALKNEIMAKEMSLSVVDARNIADGMSSEEKIVSESYLEAEKKSNDRYKKMIGIAAAIDAVIIAILALTKIVSMPVIGIIVALELALLSICVSKIKGKDKELGELIVKNNELIAKNKAQQDLLNLINDKKAEIANLTIKRDSLVNECDEFIIKIKPAYDRGNAIGALYEIKNELIKIREIKSRLEKLHANRTELLGLEKELNSYLTGFRFDEGEELGYESKMSIVRDKIREIGWINSAYEDVKAEYDKFLYENRGQNIDEIRNAKDVSCGVYTLMNSRRSVEIDIEELTAKIVGLRKEIDVLSVEADKREEYENQVVKLKEELREMNERYIVLDATKKLLGKAKENLATNYMSKMRTAFAEYLQMFDDKTPYAIDNSFETTIESKGQNYESKYFSTGNREYIELCTRLALADAMFEDEKHIMILDDPFANFDDDKVKKALEVLEELSQKKQIIYFTCHKSRTK